ncbi:hypothetical protein CFH99_13560 [Nocardioides aromaticivorans]|uniref:Integral membrane protein n=1 Tax=Nocardioides aromaticivorans TaxID=200618 RepID=A0ABX7PL01_9ACTN|nr:hypothetical protein [Nocardioides aromaticivorans]QSR26654.1 hypothetical protein CFH99_13560 [Nocardioides aromaticivorans]
MSSDDMHGAVSAPEAGRGLAAADRVPLYLFGLTLLVIVAFAAGVAQFEATECSGPEDGECDMAAFGGIFWAVCAFPAGVVAIVVAEVVRAVRRRTGRAPAGVR